MYGKRLDGIDHRLDLIENPLNEAALLRHRIEEQMNEDDNGLIGSGDLRVRVYSDVVDQFTATATLHYTSRAAGGFPAWPIDPRVIHTAGGKSAIEALNNLDTLRRAGSINRVEAAHANR